MENWKYGAKRILRSWGKNIFEKVTCTSNEILHGVATEFKQTMGNETSINIIQYSQIPNQTKCWREAHPINHCTATFELCNWHLCDCRRSYVTVPIQKRTFIQRLLITYVTLHCNVTVKMLKMILWTRTIFNLRVSIRQGACNYQSLAWRGGQINWRFVRPLHLSSVGSSGKK